MKISYNWLKEFLNIDLDAEKVGEILTDLGLEVEGIEAFKSVKGSLDGVIVGEVLSCEQHPNADRLKITQVDLGDGSPLQIVPMILKKGSVFLLVGIRQVKGHLADRRSDLFCTSDQFLGKSPFFSDRL